MERVRIVRVVVTLACAALVFAIGASTSVAAKKGKKKGLGPVVTVSATSPGATANTEVISATATCPKGKKAFGGGFAAPDDNEGLIIVHESRRTAVNAWTVTGSFFAFSPPAPPHTLTATVYCRRLAKAPSEASTAVPVLAATNNVPFTAIARCQGKKQKLLSGGFMWTPPASGNIHQALVYENQPSGKTWRASVQNSGTAPARTLTSYAYCAKGLSKAIKIVSGSNAATVPAALTPLSADSIGCPPKTRMSAGGFVSPFPSSAPMTARPLYTESLITTGWHAKVIAGFGGGPLTVTSLGICT
jgi:hypothetical protein